jgi:DNA-binding IclR family transcriptional regulator
VSTTDNDLGEGAFVEASSDRKTAFRVASVLDSLARADRDGVGVRELASETGISKSAVHRVLTHLSTLGYANQLPKEHYEAGTLMLAWAESLAERHTFERACQAALARLATASDESSYAVRYRPATRDIVFVAVAHSTQPIQYLLEMNSHAPLYAGAAGKAVLAWLDSSIVADLHIEQLTPTTITDLDGLRADLNGVVSRGYAFSRGERIRDAVGIAAPVFGDGEILGAITLTIPRYRFDDSKLLTLSREVMTAARSATRLLTADFDNRYSKP